MFNVYPFSCSFYLAPPFWTGAPSRNHTLSLLSHFWAPTLRPHFTALYCTPHLVHTHAHAYVRLHIHTLHNLAFFSLFGAEAEGLKKRVGGVGQAGAVFLPVFQFGREKFGGDGVACGFIFHRSSRGPRRMDLGGVGARVGNKGERKGRRGLTTFLGPRSKSFWMPTKDGLGLFCLISEHGLFMEPGMTAW